ncbi:GMC family oxidoreductase [Zooshikella harenae]|uniref:GMC family oxidoreductase n=1 Tax=Zooshikella harenae TaxID=2827238 RepID=A0ABS5ZG88_9GAMM|nr:GMC family oxidoreductase [Zooshikella harenae]MBU2712788.1 GMC family oxidoreductase [Zooshikella harenae]
MSSVIRDIYTTDEAKQWAIYDALKSLPQTRNFDVIIVGTGAGGGFTADILSKAGLSVALVESGPLQSSNDFNMNEQQAYQSLYQEGGSRTTEDGAISVLQGRAVGGTTVVNWTSCFRTPSQTFAYWQEHFDLAELDSTAMTPWFDYVEQQLGVSPWPIEPNRNNAILQSGCQRLGYSSNTIARNVRGCWNLGFCGTGCPTNAKQSMLVSTLPKALERGAYLIYNCEAYKVLWQNTQVKGVECRPIKGDKHEPSFTLTARHVVLAAGAIGSPALLLRSSVPDPHQQIGKRTFLHPVSASFALFDEAVDGFYGAPQSIYSDHFQWPADQQIGYKLEVPPLQPMLAAGLLKGFGKQHRQLMQQLPHIQCTIALHRDGFHPQSPGGQVSLRADGSPVLNYPITRYLWDGIKRSLATMARIQFAAGAHSVIPSHSSAQVVNNLQAALQQLNQLAWQPNQALIGSAHVMGGCGMSAKPKAGVVNHWGEYFFLDNLSVIDGSCFPTSIGANPQLSIYALACRQATHLSAKLGNPITLTNNQKTT